MGKVSKAKKKRCKAAALLVKSKDNVVEGTDCSDAALDDDDDDDDVDTSDDGAISDADMIVSINILNLVGRRADIYESKSMKSLRTALFPLIQLQISKGSHFESSILDISTLSNSFEEEILPRKLSTLLRIATAYSNDHNLFLSPNIKSFRAALHPLVIAQQRRMSKKPSLTSISESLNQTHSSRVSAAFRSRNWSIALHELYQMYQSSESPKLGALQRWVRECDFALQQQSMVPLMNGVEAVEQVECSRNISLLLLDAVMRVAKLKKVCRLPNISVEHTPPCTAIVHHYRMADQLSSEKVAISAPNIHLMNGITASNFKAEKLRILSHIPGALRRPPSDNDLNIFSIAPRTISFKESELCAIKTDVPGVSDTFLILNVLSGDECNQLISVAETIGYCHDAVEGIDNIVLFADNSLLSPIFERCRHLLPQKGLMGINSRFRFFRYSKGAVYRPHIDGSWPGSGIVDGAYVDDAFGGEQNSKLTFLIYLNGDGDFEGGSTTFFLPGEECGHIEARAVHPQRGAVLVFPHGEVTSPVHEGSEISEGHQKYVIRTDVLYRSTINVAGS